MMIPRCKAVRGEWRCDLDEGHGGEHQARWGQRPDAVVRWRNHRVAAGGVDDQEQP